MAQQFYIRVRGKVQGPFEPERLRELAKRGRFSRSYEVSTDGVEWSRAAKFPDLFPPPPERKVMKLPPAPQIPLTETVVAADLDDLFVLDDEPDLVGEEAAWHYVRNGEKFGPIPFSELELLFATDQLQPDELVWTEGMPNWIPARHVPQLAAGAKVAAAPASAAPSASHAAAESPRSAPMAVASLVLALAGLNCLYLFPIALARSEPALFGVGAFVFLASILAVVFGHIALGQIKTSTTRLTGRGMAIAGLIAGYFVIGAATVVAIVIAFLVLFGASLVSAIRQP